ncbi:hypothetical protein MKX08_003886 [Trichoderma sp. CBMAI-0020]|nr:hypothetical protein MKX08_003886 [Trichoderma sp. CBMAI-0020]
MEPHGQKSSKPEPVNYAAEQHCVLCRHKVHLYQDPDQVESSDKSRNIENWETAVRVLGYVDPQISGNADIAPHVFCLELHIISLNEVYRVNPNMRIRLKPCGFAHTAGPVFFVHSACRELAQMLEAKPSYADLYNLGLQLCETMPRDCFETPKLRQLASFASASDLADSEWKTLLLGCAKLPTELQCKLLEYVSANRAIFSWLTGLKNCSLGLMSPRAVLPHPDSVSDLADNSKPKAAYLYASFVNIFGADYLRHVEVLNAPIRCDDLKGRRACIKANIDQICSMEIILGLIGVSAIRFHLTDGFKTSWLGSTVQGWRCGPLEVTLRDINLLKNGHKNILKQLIDIHVFHRTKRSQGIPVFWDVDRDLPGSGEAFLAAHSKYYAPQFRVLHGFQPQAMCSCLPLRENGVPVRGITVYACDRGTNSVIVHTRSSDVEVSAPGRRGTPTSFYFRQGEEIVTMGMVGARHSDRLGPYLVFKTNQQRLMFFGPPLGLQDKLSEYVSMIPHHLKQGCAVSGLIVDILSKEDKRLTAFGAHCESRQNTGVAGGKAPLPECQIRLPVVPKVVVDNWYPYLHVVKVTRASLAQVEQLRVQQRLVMPTGDLRCAGLFIRHTDGSVETLGCWDGSSTAPSNLIYDSETDGKLCRLVFHLRARATVYHRNAASYYMSNIVAHTDCPQGQRVIERPKYIIDDEEFEIEEMEHEEIEDEEMEDEEMDDEEMDDEETAELGLPDQKVDLDMTSEHPFITWCFTNKFDHIDTKDAKTVDIKLQQRNGGLNKIR